MFTYEQIQRLNALELDVYNYITLHMEEVTSMKIRELADALHVSTSTILRFCAKVGCSGYSELKVKLRIHLDEKDQHILTEDLSMIAKFVKHAGDEEFDALLQRCVDLIMDRETVVFFGVGSSGILARYGARYFSNMGKYSQYIDDPYYPTSPDNYKSCVMIALSVSGESQQTLEQIEKYKAGRADIVTICNTDSSTAAKMADINIAYYMPFQKLRYDYNVTTQVPLVLILEMLGHKIGERLRVQ